MPLYTVVGREMCCKLQGTAHSTYGWQRGLAEISSHLSEEWQRTLTYAAIFFSSVQACVISVWVNDLLVSCLDFVSLKPLLSHSDRLCWHWHFPCFRSKKQKLLALTYILALQQISCANFQLLPSHLTRSCSHAKLLLSYFLCNNPVKIHQPKEMIPVTLQACLLDFLPRPARS